MRFNTGRIFKSAEPAPRRETVGAGHADRDTFAMHEACPIIMGDRLERMAECMPEVQKRSFAGLVLVAADDRGLGGAALGNGVNAVRSARENIRPMGLGPGEKFRVGNQAIFDDFGIARTKFALGQGFERTCISKHKGWLMKSPDEIFPMR